MALARDMAEPWVKEQGGKWAERECKLGDRGLGNAEWWVSLASCCGSDSKLYEEAPGTLSSQETFWLHSPRWDFPQWSQTMLPEEMDWDGEILICSKGNV